jgi:hypothetical protein
MQSIKNMNWGMAVAGVWVTIAPFVLGYSSVTAAVLNGVIVGVSVTILAGYSAVAERETRIRTLGWITAALGLWLVLAPFILGYAPVVAALWSDIIAGILILALSLWTERELSQVLGHVG